MSALNLDLPLEKGGQECLPSKRITTGLTLSDIAHNAHKLHC